MQTTIKNIYAYKNHVMPVSAIKGKNTVNQLTNIAIQQAKIVSYQLATFPIKY
jgi:hypothetical protein